VRLAFAAGLLRLRQGAAPQALRRALLVALLALALPAAAETQLPVERLAVVTEAGGRYVFRVELADTPASQERGLMFRRAMAADAGMLFAFGDTAMRSFWMKNTEIPLDILFVERSGRIAHIHHRAEPQSLAAIGSRVPVWAVLELNGGTAKRLGIRPGDRVEHRIFAP